MASYRNLFKQFRLQTGSTEELNRQFDLVRNAFNVAQAELDKINAVLGIGTGTTPVQTIGETWQIDLSYGWKGSSGALPPAEGQGVFWLRPVTWDDLCVVFSEPVTDGHAPIEWPVSGSYTKARLQVFVSDIFALPGHIDIEMTHEFDHDTPVEFTGIADETLVMHDETFDYAIGDGEHVGVLVRYVGAVDWSAPGSAWFTVRLTLSN